VKHFWKKKLHNSPLKALLNSGGFLYFEFTAAASTKTSLETMRFKIS